MGGPHIKSVLFQKLSKNETSNHWNFGKESYLPMNVNLKCFLKGIIRQYGEKNCSMEPKNVIPSMKYGGGSLMVWGHMSTKAEEKLVFIVK